MTPLETIGVVAGALLAVGSIAAFGYAIWLLIRQGERS